jgi:hypothetical protein
MLMNIIKARDHGLLQMILHQVTGKWTFLWRPALAGIFNLFWKMHQLSVARVIGRRYGSLMQCLLSCAPCSDTRIWPWEWFCHPEITSELHLESQLDPLSNDICRIGRTHLLWNVPSGVPVRVSRDRVEAPQSM